MPPKKSKGNQHSVKDYCRIKAERFLVREGIIDKHDTSPEADRLIRSLATYFRRVWNDAGRKCKDYKK